MPNKHSPNRENEETFTYFYIVAFVKHTGLSKQSSIKSVVLVQQISYRVSVLQNVCVCVCVTSIIIQEILVGKKNFGLT